MSDLCEISEKKYKSMRCAAIIMPIIAVVLVTAFVWLMSALYKGFTAEYAPTEGVWYCEELGMELDFDGKPEYHGYLMTDADGTQYILDSFWKQMDVRIYTIAETIPMEENGKVRYAYYAGELAYEFIFVSLEEDRYTVRDEAGNKYVFVRK